MSGCGTDARGRDGRRVVSVCATHRVVRRRVCVVGDFNSFDMHGDTLDFDLRIVEMTSTEQVVMCSLTRSERRVYSVLFHVIMCVRVVVVSGGGGGGGAAAAAAAAAAAVVVILVCLVCAWCVCLVCCVVTVVAWQL